MGISREELLPTAPNHAQALTEKKRAKSTTMADRDNQYHSSRLGLGLAWLVRINPASEN